MRDALKRIRRWNYDLALLTTRVPGFFARLSFLEAPVVIGHQCPARGLQRLPVPSGYRLAPLDYYEQWPTLAAIYREYSYQRTGMQLREDRFWESWPRRGTFPLGYSNEVGGLGYVAYAGNEIVAYLAGQILPDMPHLAITEFGHLNDHPEAMLVLLQQAAQYYLQTGGRRVLIYTAGGTPVLKLLEQHQVPFETDTAQGLMAKVISRKWIRPAGFRNVHDATNNLFFPSIPVLWHRDGY